MRVYKCSDRVTNPVPLRYSFAAIQYRDGVYKEADRETDDRLIVITHQDKALPANVLYYSPATSAVSIAHPLYWDRTLFVETGEAVCFEVK